MKNIIYDNYDLYELFDETKAFLQEEYPDEFIADDSVWDEIYHSDQINWEEEEARLTDFFGSDPVILFGTTERWTGKQTGAQVFGNFWDAFRWATKDCDYVRIYEERGHFFIKCSHHDGTNEYQLKIVSQKGYDFYQNWEYDYNNSRSETNILLTIIKSNFLSRLPHFCKAVYGCKEV